MGLSLPVRAAICGVIAVSAAATIAVRAVDFGPRVDVKLRLRWPTDTIDVWEIRMTARGGETIESVNVEPILGNVVISKPTGTANLQSGQFFITRLNVSHPGLPPAVRVVQSGRVERIYEFELDEGGR